MADFDKIKRTPRSTLDPALLALCLSIEAKRARTVIDHILEHGIITNEELSDLYGYDHPPRAIRDVRENGIPLVTHNVTSPKTGRRMGAYTFDDVSKIKRGRIGGRKAFSKKFKQDLLEMYGSKDAFTGEGLDERYLQIDHRIPYEVIGDENGNAALDPREFMLLDASSNRAKSWSCEHCDNLLKKHDPDICRRCFWASPEDYDHIAETESRRVEVVWTGDEAQYYDSLKKEAEDKSIEIAAFIKRKLRE
ncbi:helix-turn-helix domain-containing protein [Pseudophaeobacter flagellatus]|uniref:helix-turn-helix domain-containing protein n=1 Tax=Pseudophaeobacter flagellatus TaxID=2899119 RepID=UPI001E2A2EB3|nr:helix-turn-helix domain-containing protein [Pseudophaeobacter flagellatus]MCD9150157.1 helix-turn-helix domain-containing protein [Pseudophaeobacter flagellatus]